VHRVSIGVFGFSYLLHQSPEVKRPIERGAGSEHRKRSLARLVAGPKPGIALNDHYIGDGDIVRGQGTA
jgi:hypothetical protein